MCGIAGYWAKADPASASDGTARAMASAIAHRGPDGAGAWSDPESGIAFGHRRLAIIDLTPAGAQPMASADGRWMLCFNGEIYNFEELRADLERRFGPIAWRGACDSEVLVEALARLGLDTTLPRLTGMFALAAWDRQTRTLHLARDRMGEKPIYWGWQGDTLLFGSELKALAAHPAFARRLNRDAVCQYLRFAYVPAPLSIYEGIGKLLPGHAVSIGPDRAEHVRAYWTLPRPDPRPLDVAATTDRFEALIAAAVARQMRSDVPMGAFLSGGIDSSMIVALMQRRAATPVRTFSIGFEAAAFDESGAAAAVARHLGTEHRQLTVTAADALAVVPQLATLYDEPFADSSQIPTYLLAKLTREYVTVALSGDGGDELFSGYARHLSFDGAWGPLARVPTPLRRAAAAAMGLVPDGAWSAAARAAPGPVGRAVTPARMAKLARAMGAADAQDYYTRLVEIAPGQLGSASTPFDTHHIGRDFEHPVLGMSYVDQQTYLPDDILVKVDRATMANSLEARVPLLDHAVVEAAAELPMSLRVAGGVGKRVLRAVLDRHVPSALVDRPKQGFSIPLAEWLRGPLRAWADALLADRPAVLDGLIDWRAVEADRAMHAGGRADRADRLWSVLMLLQWVREWRPV